MTAVQPLAIAIRDDRHTKARRLGALRSLLAAGPLPFNTIFRLTAICEPDLRELLSSPAFTSPAPDVYRLAGGDS